ncbi:Sua5/YciO/YrdC/YwlC family protein [Cesiribacter sp. SM1]|uniref:Sua5/YciO/YrdC/YwlC family protein n=1 Tax=Cesiribacter sp. SM1 TaxID=2861196 RepID=UPI001CD48C9E|nr:Sua5/YciO/YrdC/YwlC family protein [Cesiribacter sp. SM1]
MKNLDTLANHLKAGGFLLAEGKSSSWLLCSTRQPQALEKLEKMLKEENEPEYLAFILIGRMNDLYEYVMNFSDLAWDIAEGSEKALLIWYNNAKVLVPKEVKDEQGNVGVMLNRCKTLEPLLQKIGHGLLSIQVSATAGGWQALPDVLPLPLDAECRLAPERIMRLSAEGDVKFLKY